MDISSLLMLGGSAASGFGLSCLMTRSSQKPPKKAKKANDAPLVKQAISLCLAGMDAHIARVMEQTQVIEDPFPHLVVENLLPEKLYQHACSIWPASSEFAGGKNAQRHTLPVTYGCLEDTTLPKDQKVFWRIFGEVIVNRYLKPKLADKFKPFLCQKLGLEESWNSFHPDRDTCNLRQDCLIIDRDCPNMLPHIDQLNMLAQIMIYFPEDDEHQEMGTVFYEGSPSTTPNNIYEVNNPADIRFAKKVPYRPNTLVVFIQSPTAWHGYERPKHVDPQYARRLYLSPLFFSPEFMERHYKGIYSRSTLDEYFFDHRFLHRKNWVNIWGDED